MEKLTCPLCGNPVVTLPALDLFDVPGVLIGRHLLNPGAQTPAWALGRDVCLATGMSPALAQGVADDRRAGVHLRAHP